MSATVQLNDALRGHDSIRKALDNFIVEQIELSRDELERRENPEARAAIAFARELRRSLKMTEEKEIHHGSQASRRARA